MNDTAQLTAGQFWTLTDTMSGGGSEPHRVEVLDIDTYPNHQDLVRLRDWDARLHSKFAGWISQAWFTAHATLLHESVAAAHDAAWRADRCRDGLYCECTGPRHLCVYR